MAEFIFPFRSNGDFMTFTGGGFYGNCGSTATMPRLFSIWMGPKFGAFGWMFFFHPLPPTIHPPTTNKIILYDNFFFLPPILFYNFKLERFSLRQHLRDRERKKDKSIIFFLSFFFLSLAFIYFLYLY